MPSSIPAGENPGMRITLDNSFQRITVPFEPAGAPTDPNPDPYDY
jgi:hypothetical protein